MTDPTQPAEGPAGDEQQGSPTPPSGSRVDGKSAPDPAEGADDAPVGGDGSPEG